MKHKQTQTISYGKTSSNPKHVCLSISSHLSISLFVSTCSLMEQYHPTDKTQRKVKGHNTSLDKPRGKLKGWSIWKTTCDLLIKNKKKSHLTLHISWCSLCTEQPTWSLGGPPTLQTRYTLHCPGDSSGLCHLHCNFGIAWRFWQSLEQTLVWHVVEQTPLQIQHAQTEESHNYQQLQAS